MTHLLLHACSGLHPAQALLSATLSTASNVATGVLTPVDFQPHRLPAGPLVFIASALQALGRPPLLHPDCPHSLDALLSSPLISRADLTTFLPSVGWPHPLSSPLHPLPSLQPVARIIPVSAGTAVLLTPSLRKRRSLHAAYIAEALPPPPSTDRTTPTTDYRLPTTHVTSLLLFDQLGNYPGKTSIRSLSGDWQLTASRALTF